MRGLLATLLLLVALVAALVVQTMAYVGRDLVDSDRFAGVTVAAVTGEDGRAVVSETLAGAVVDVAAARGATLPERYLVAIRASAGAAAQRPGFAATLRPAVVDSHRRVLDAPGEGVVIPLGALRDEVAAAVQPFGPQVAALVPPPEGFPTLRVPLPEGSEPVVRAARALRDGWPVAILVVLVAAAAGIAVAGSPPAAAGGFGTGLLLLALVPVGVRLATPVAVDLAAPDSVRPLAEDLALGAVDGWLQAAAWTAAAGLALVVTGGVWGARMSGTRRGRPRRRR